MPSWKILLTDGLTQNGQDILREFAFVDDKNGITAEEILEIIAQYDAMIVRGRTKVTREVFRFAENLKVIGRAGVGVDNIDLASAQVHHVTVVNTPTATTIAVAEHTIALMLSLIRSIPQADIGMKSGQWLKQQLIGIELSGKSLGIIGMGRIGTAVGERAKALGMKILGYDPLLDEMEIIKRGAEPTDLNNLYKDADLITLHVPLTPQTRFLIDSQAIGHMKRGVRIICTARGGIIDETALLAGLESGQIAGVSLDVFAEEPPGMSALVAHPKVLATPHIGAQTIEAQARAANDVAIEVLAALKHEPLRWKIV
ncbi:MAG: hydroxyacid dehydrogenase [Anaerolineales bacterium]|nr:hydroxyacid dehydrogenase [Anaerolineales bacterium]